MLLATIPKKEYAEGATDLDLAFGEPKMERALGVQWCLSSDKSIVNSWLNFWSSWIYCTFYFDWEADPAKDVPGEDGLV